MHDIGVTTTAACAHLKIVLRHKVKAAVVREARADKMEQVVAAQLGVHAVRGPRAVPPRRLQLRPRVARLVAILGRADELRHIPAQVCKRHVRNAHHAAAVVVHRGRDVRPRRRRLERKRACQCILPRALDIGVQMLQRGSRKRRPDNLNFAALGVKLNHGQLAPRALIHPTRFFKNQLDIVGRGTAACITTTWALFFHFMAAHGRRLPLVLRASHPQVPVADSVWARHEVVGAVGAVGQPAHPLIQVHRPKLLKFA